MNTLIQQTFPEWDLSSIKDRFEAIKDFPAFDPTGEQAYKYSEITFGTLTVCSMLNNSQYEAWCLSKQQLEMFDHRFHYGFRLKSIKK